MAQDSQPNRITLTVLETSDVHGNLMPIHYANNRPHDVGLAKLATLIKRQRAANPTFLWIDNGDMIQGTPLAYHHARLDPEPPNPMILVMNELKADGAVLGNHEFNYGRAHLDKAVRESHFPWMAANIVDSASGEPAFGKPYLVKELEGGVRVAMLGLCTPYIPNWENPAHIEGLAFLDAVETAKVWVPKLRAEEKPDVMIVAYHGGFERDLDTGEPTEPLTGENQGYALCMDVPGIDVLLTGHQHRTIEGKTINGVLVAQPGHRGEQAARIMVTLERADGGPWGIVSKQSELLSVQGVEADETVLRMAAEYERKTQEWLDQPMGCVEGDMVVLDPMRIRLGDSPLIEFINRVQMEAAGTSISNTALFADDSPGIPPNVTMRDIVSNYIYPNTLKVIRITGQDMRDALELSASYFQTSTDGTVAVNPSFMQPKPQPYNYDMWEGITYTLDIRLPVGERVVELSHNGEPVRMDAQYDVVMNNYRAGGGGNYTMYQGKPVVKDIPTDVSELIADYILQRGTIHATLDRNWKVVY
ncbi:bifunctional metallophosphatase/5'-nucleotidase [Paenibacillus sp. HJGM_3]|uniref:bifunctional metallophosphatase/5'-nucleotidase n=1 Tax=Paenibacillus sp. HJGM_3 TaxID=3379816 RepID=UPI00385CC7E3